MEMESVCIICSSRWKFQKKKHSMLPALHETGGRQSKRLLCLLNVKEIQQLFLTKLALKNNLYPGDIMAAVYFDVFLSPG